MNRKICLTLLAIPLLAFTFAGARAAPKPSPTPADTTQTLSPPRPQYVVTKIFKVLATAYYGPQRGQPHYLHGTYQKDIRINGSGKQTILGLPPRIGMVAADFSFFKPGSKLLITDPLDGKEKVYTVADTGEAMVGKRIDFFMGHGIQGLRAAEKVGKREIVVKLLSEAAS